MYSNSIQINTNITRQVYNGPWVVKFISAVRKGPSKNYVTLNLAIFDPLPPM